MTELTHLLLDTEDDFFLEALADEMSISVEALHQLILNGDTKTLLNGLKKYYETTLFFANQLEDVPNIITSNAILQIIERYLEIGV